MRLKVFIECEREDVMGFRTIKDNTRVEMIEKRSKFIASVFRVENQEQVQAYLAEIRKEFYDATHNVYAYTFGIDYPYQRYSDDGEPQGTAGLPVMETINKNYLSNVLIVVTRYFGGILLGASGLVRAYTKSAALVIEKAGILEYRECKKIIITLDYQYMDKIKWLIEIFSAKIEDIEYSDVIDMTILINIERYEEFIKKAIDVTKGEILIDEKDVVLALL